MLWGGGAGGAGGEGVSGVCVRMGEGGVTYILVDCTVCSSIVILVILRRIDKLAENKLQSFQS